MLNITSHRKYKFGDYLGFMRIALSPPPSSSRHSHLLQKVSSTLVPQQSPPSKSHPSILLSSSQYPSPFHEGSAQPAKEGIIRYCFFSFAS